MYINNYFFQITPLPKQPCIKNIQILLFFATKQQVTLCLCWSVFRDSFSVALGACSGTHATCLCLRSDGIRGVCHHHLAVFHILPVNSKVQSFKKGQRKLPAMNNWHNHSIFNIMRTLVPLTTVLIFIRNRPGILRSVLMTLFLWYTIQDFME